MDALSLAAQRLEAEAEREAQAETFRADPTAWLDTRLGEHVWSKQGEIMLALRKHRRVAVRSCHGVDKSHIASRAVTWVDSLSPSHLAELRERYAAGD